MPYPKPVDWIIKLYIGLLNYSVQKGKNSDFGAYAESTVAQAQNPPSESSTWVSTEVCLSEVRVENPASMLFNRVSISIVSLVKLCSLDLSRDIIQSQSSVKFRLGEERIQTEDFNMSQNKSLRSGHSSRKWGNRVTSTPFHPQSCARWCGMAV